MKEYKVGEIFELNGEIFQCVEDPRDFDCEDCMLCVDCFPCSESSREDGKNVHFVKVTEITEGMLFRADNGKLYRFTTDLKDGEKCSCQIGGYNCSAILRQICSLNPRLWDRLPCERWFVLVNESEERGVPPVRRHIEIAVDAVEGENVRFHIAEQTHRGPRFCERGPEFRAKNGVLLCSGGFPQVDVKANALFVWGPRVEDGDVAVFAGVGLFARIMEAVTEYNETNGEGYEKPWPQKGDKYYCLNSAGCINEYGYDNDYMDLARRKLGNFFRTSEEAEAAAKHVKKVLQAVDAE